MNRIRELRVSRGMNQEELAALVQVSRPAIGHYERGERFPDFDTIDQLCTIFGVTADYLLGRSDIPQPQISDEDWLLLDAYRRASLRDRQLVDSILQEYRADDKKVDAL